MEVLVGMGLTGLALYTLFISWVRCHGNAACVLPTSGVLKDICQPFGISSKHTNPPGGAANNKCGFPKCSH